MYPPPNLSIDRLFNKGGSVKYPLLSGALALNILVGGAAAPTIANAQSDHSASRQESARYQRDPNFEGVGANQWFEWQPGGDFPIVRLRGGGTGIYEGFDPATGISYIGVNQQQGHYVAFKKDSGPPVFTNDMPDSAIGPYSDNSTQVASASVPRASVASPASNGIPRQGPLISDQGDTGQDSVSPYASVFTGQNTIEKLGSGYQVTFVENGAARKLTIRRPNISGFSQAMWDGLNKGSGGLAPGYGLWLADKTTDGTKARMVSVNPQGLVAVSPLMPMADIGRAVSMVTGGKSSLNEGPAVAAER